MQRRAITSSPLLREDDLALVDALQINPRISWGALASALDVDATTIARRWRRLSRSGAAWTTAMPGPRQIAAMTLAYIEIDCEVDRWQEIVNWLHGQPHIITVQHLSGGLTLWCSVFAPSEERMADYVISVLLTLPGVRTVRTNIAMRVFDSSRQWRLQVLGKHDAHRLRPSLMHSTAVHDFDLIDRRIFALLAVDGRSATSALSQRVGISQRSVQRRLNYLLNATDIELRCDLARGLAGWHSAAILWANVPEAEIERIGKTLVGWEETRSCAAIAGRANFMLTIALHAAKDLYTFTQRLTSVFPELVLVDRQIVLRQHKLYGHILSSAGLKTATAEIDPWHLLECKDCRQHS